MNVYGIALYPFIILRNKDYSLIRINHERIHLAQQKEMLVIFFFLWYIIEGIIKGYDNISFEKEAYKNQHDLGYLTKRRFWSFLKYI